MKVSFETIDTTIVKLNKKKNQKEDQKEDLSALPAWIEPKNWNVFSLRSFYTERYPQIGHVSLDHEIHLTIPDDQVPHGVTNLSNV